MGDFLVSGRMPAWEINGVTYHPESRECFFGIGYNREHAIQLANKAIASGWKDVTIWEP